MIQLYIEIIYKWEELDNMDKIVLASKSPRRREILENLGVAFTVMESGADESGISAEEIAPELYVQELALIKASECAKKIKDKRLIISADTIVCADGIILGKPCDKNDAFRMLRMLSGRKHEVYTGFCVMKSDDADSVCRACKTEVTFKELSDAEIEAYIKTGEPMDKAGAYGIQGFGSLLVSKISGDYLNVVGLPVSELSDVLKNEFGYYIIKE